MDFAAARRAMVDSQLRPQAVTDPLVVAAMATVPREDFVPTEARAVAYIDRLLPLGKERALSPPASIGQLLTALAPRPGETALVVGAATGYVAALLADMGLKVVAVESDSDLCADLDALADVIVLNGPLGAGAPERAPFDLILIDGAIEQVPQPLIDQLRIGGRLGAGLIEGGVTRLVTGTRASHGFGLKSFADATMAPLPGFTRPRVFSF